MHPKMIIMREMRELIQDSIRLKQDVLQNAELLQSIQELCDMAVETYRKGGKILLCGNGGSASDAQHIAAELSGRFYYDREPLDAEALHVNTSYLTAVANDYSYDEVYARLLKARGQEGDLLIAISTSGNSENILRAAKAARGKALLVGGVTGADGGKLKGYTDILINVPSKDTPRIQEVHILIGHILCEYIEAKLFPAP